MPASMHCFPTSKSFCEVCLWKFGGCLCSGLPLSIMVKFGGSWLWKPPIPPKEDGCLRLSVQFACQLRVEWLRQAGSRNPFSVLVARCVWRFGFELRWNSFNIACGILSSPHRSQTCYLYRNPNPGASKED